jgi:transposase
LPHLAGVTVARIHEAGGRVVIDARSLLAGVKCPSCGVESTGVHGRYQRQLADAAVTGRPVVLRLLIRRFLCRNPGCRRVTFAEQIGGLTTPHARMSPPLRAALTAIATALAGRAGARLATRLGMPVGRDTLLKLLRSVPEPQAGDIPVLGVDDFALRRGQVYGTLLVDMASRRPVDVLPDRTAETLAGWLTARPGVQVICRDRAGNYAEGARIGAPAAIQVADRWHLWRNLCEAVERAVVRHRTCLPEPVAPSGQQSAPGDAAESPLAHEAETRLTVRTRQRYAQVQQLLGQGCSISAIARQLRLDRHTARRYATAPSIETLLAKTTSRGTLLDAFKPYLHRRFNEGCTDAARLTDEIRAQGYQGSDQTVRRHLRPFRATRTAPPPAPTPPKVRHVTGWIMRDPDNLKPEDEVRLNAILSRCPHLQAVRRHVTEFAKMMVHLRGHRLQQWIDQVHADDLPDLHSFLIGLRRDQAAVTAGLTLPHSSGPVEGHVNRIKTIKRQMYGRATFALLRKRILLTS